MNVNLDPLKCGDVVLLPLAPIFDKDGATIEPARVMRVKVEGIFSDGLIIGTSDEGYQVTVLDEAVYTDSKRAHDRLLHLVADAIIHFTDED